MLQQDYKINLDDLLTERDEIVGRPIVINLDKDTERWNDMCEHLSKWEITPERYPAVSGVKLPSVPASMSEHECSVSLNLTHAAVSRHCYMRTKKMFWLVLEDDCRFLKNPKEIVFETLETLFHNKTDWSVVSLGCFSYDNQAKKPELNLNSTVLTQPAGWYPWGTHSYLMNREHSMSLAATWSLCVNPTDHLLIHEYNIKRGYLRRPSITYQEEYPSYRGGRARTIERADLDPDLIREIYQDKLNKR